MRVSERKPIIRLAVVMIMITIIMTIFSIPILSIHSLGKVLFPGDGFWNVTGEVPERATIELSGINDKVTIIRDDWGVPHIYGEYEEDVFFAMGFVHAQDRLFQMDLYRRVARGRLSEVLGESVLGEDKLHLAIGMEYWANKTLQKGLDMAADGEITFFPTIESYINGINYYIRTAKSKPLEYYLLDFEPTEFTLLDLMSILKFLSFYYSWGYSDLYRLTTFDAFTAVNASWYAELYPKYFPYQIPVCPNYGNFPQSPTPNLNSSEISPELVKVVSGFLSEIEQLESQKALIDSGNFRGSNNWVVSGTKSDTGLPILANDQHWGWPLPQFLYESHLVSADTNLNFFGYTVPGLPYPIVGFNEYVGWGETIFPADVLDWYFFDTDGDDHYIYNGESIAYTEREYNIKVKDKSSVKLTVKDTVHGPVLNEVFGSRTPDSLDSSNIVLAPKWIPNNITFEWQAIYEMIHAQNRQEFDDASRLLDTPPMNIVYGDVDGNIAIRPTGKVPIRDDSKIPLGYYGNGSLPYNGSNGEGEWIGYVPFEDLPNTMNPSQNYLASANQIAAGPDYKDYFLQNSYAPSYRARRINDVLNGSLDGSISVSDMATLQYDIQSSAAESFTPYIIYTIESTYGSTPPTQIASILTLLNDWDYVMDKDLVAPTIYRKWRAFFYDFTFEDEFSTYNARESAYWTLLEYFMKEQENSHWFDDISTSLVKETRDDIMLKAFNSTVEWLEDFYGTSDPSSWRWGDLHKLYFSSITGLDALSKGPYEGGGEAVTVNPSPVNIENGVGYSGGGAAHRLIVDFSNISNSRTCISGGQSGLSNSKHYADQLEQLFLQGKQHYTYILHTTLTFPSNVIESIIYLNPLGG